MECRMNGFKVWYVFRLFGMGHDNRHFFVVADNSAQCLISYFLNAEALGASL